MDRALERLRAAYDADAERRAAVEPEPWRLEIVDALAGRLSTGASVVDLGCGTGQMAQRLLDHDLEVAGVDLSPAMVAEAARLGVDARVADFRSLPFEDASFDGALAFNTLLHTPRAELGAVFTEIRRVLRSGAPFTVVVWGGRTHEGPHVDDWLDPPRFFSFLSDADLLALPTPGFERHDAWFLHEHANRMFHPQVLALTAVQEQA